MSSSTNSIHERLESMVLPICDELELQVYDIEVKPSSAQGLVRVVLERKNVAGPGTGITLAEVTGVTRPRNYPLGVAGFIPLRRRIEVTFTVLCGQRGKPPPWGRSI